MNNVFSYITHFKLSPASKLTTNARMVGVITGCNVALINFSDFLCRRIPIPENNSTFWRCSYRRELVLTDDIRHADPLLNSKVLISSEHSIPTSILLGNLQLSSLFNEYTVLSFRRGCRACGSFETLPYELAVASAVRLLLPPRTIWSILARTL